MARHTLSHAVDLYSGEAQKNGFLGSNRGLPIDLLILDDLGTPAIEDVDGYVNGLNVTGAGNFSLKTATGALIDSSDVGVADVARGIQIVSAGADTAVLTITGTDKFGTALTEDITLNGTTKVFGKKAFKKVSQIATDGTTSNNIDVGTSDLLGLTYRVENEEDIVAIYENGAAGRTARAVAAAAPAAVTAVATIAQTAAAMSATPASSLVAAASTALSVSAVNPNAITNYTAHGSGSVAVVSAGATDLDSTAAALATLENEVTSVQGETVALVTDMAATKVEVDRLVVENDDVKVQVDLIVLENADAVVQTDLLVLESASYKEQIDKLVLDVAAQKVELDKLILDVDLGTVGSFVKAVSTAATATTGDVRGTYDPSTVLDGVKTIKVLLRPKARTSIGAYGVAQA